MLYGIVGYIIAEKHFKNISHIGRMNYEKKILSVFICLTMIVTMLQGMVFISDAVDNTLQDISTGSLYLRYNSGTQYSRNNSSWTSYSGTLTVTGTTTSKIISVASGNHTVIFEDLNINVSGTSGAAAVLISDNATLNVVLSGTNAVTSGANRPGIDVAE